MYLKLILILSIAYSCSKKSEESITIIKKKKELITLEKVFIDYFKRAQSKLLIASKENNKKQFFEKYTVGKIGVRSNKNYNAKSNIYIPSNKKVDNKILNYVKRTDDLEIIWDSIKSNKNNYVTWLYSYHVDSTVLRLYPWADLPKIFGESTEWTMLKFMKNETDIKSVGKEFCTFPYNDVGGLGLNISCCQFSIEKRFEDRILYCADFDLKSFIQNIKKELLKEKVIIDKFYISSTGGSFHYKNDIVLDLANNVIRYEKITKKKLLLESDFFKFKLFRVLD